MKRKRPKQDAIPTLPPMRKPLVRRRRRSYRPLVVVIIVLAVVGIGVIAIAVKARYRQLADNSFHEAEQLFQGGSFRKAQQEYESFTTEYPADPRSEQARFAAELSKIAASFDDDRLDPRQTIEQLERVSREPHDEVTAKERWPIVLTTARRTARSLLERANRSLTASDYDSGVLWLEWLHRQQQRGGDGTESLDLETLDRLSAGGRDAIAAEARRRKFVEAANRAVTDGGTANFAEAFHAYEQWRAEKPAADATVQAEFVRLQQALRAQIRFSSAPVVGETPPSVPLLPLESHTLLCTRVQHAAVQRTADRTVFARVKDLCYGLDAATGAPRWVMRVGFDAPLPETVQYPGQPAALVTWFHHDEPMIALCNALTGETIWSWKVPDDLAGTPVMGRDAVFVATRRGELWWLDAAQGAVRGVAALPEPIDSAATLREDGRGFGVVGAGQAVYLFDIARETPECSDVVFIGRRSDTAHCQLLWVPPYIVVFENELMNRCFVRVLFQESAGFRQVRQIELDGRMWQPPVLDGADIFMVTDRWKTYCFGLDPGNAAVNLYTAATQVRVPAELPNAVRPYFGRVSDLPFVSLTNALYGCRPDRAQGLIRELWTKPMPHPESRSVQPLQNALGLVVVTLEEPESDGALLQAFSASQGELAWETRVGGNARTLTVLSGPQSRILAQTYAGTVFLISRDPAIGHYRSELLGIPSPTSPVHQAPSSTDVVYASDGGTTVHVVSSNSWSRAGESLKTTPIASDLGICDGEWTIRTGDQIESRRGRWTLYITRDRKLAARPIDGQPDDIHEVNLPTIGDGRWTWAPFVHGTAGIIAAHSRGIVCRAEVRKLDDITHLVIAEQRDDLGELVQAPISMGDHLLCIGRDGRCTLLDPITLHTQADWHGPAAIRGGIADDERVWLALEDSTIICLRAGGGSLEPEWQKAMEGSGWTLVAGLDSSRIMAVHASGYMVPVDKASGQIGDGIRVPAPLAISPQRCGDELVMATADGAVLFLPASGAGRD